LNYTRLFLLTAPAEMPFIRRAKNSDSLFPKPSEC